MSTVYRLETVCPWCANGIVIDYIPFLVLYDCPECGKTLMISEVEFND